MRSQNDNQVSVLNNDVKFRDWSNLDHPPPRPTTPGQSLTFHSSDRQFYIIDTYFSLDTYFGNYLSL